MLTPNMMLSQYKVYVETLCTRTFEQHRELPCNVLKEAIINHTEPKCKKCTYEQVTNSPSGDS